jgi:hypothetical protein
MTGRADARAFLAALALLRHAFGAFYAGGEGRCPLGVDTRNSTGTRGVYERACMRVLWQADVFEKELRQAEAAA